MTPPDTPPRKFEVKDQLKRMLASPRFVNAPNPSAFLEYVVQRAIEGKKTSGHHLASHLFKDKFVKDESADVRVTKSNLGKLMAKYYAQEGHDDIVIITFPEAPKDKSIKLKEGEAYTPRFSYNPEYWLATGLRFGYISLDRWSYKNHLRAFEIFSALLEKQTGHVGPTLGLVETLCNFDDRNWQNPLHVEWYSTCCDLLSTLPPEDHRYWRYWAVRGLVELTQGDLEKAKTAFEEALALDRALTEGYEPYITFIFKTNKTGEGLALANRYLGQHLGDASAHARFGLFLVQAGRFDEGMKYLAGALDLEPGNCAAHELLAAAFLAVGDIPRFVNHMQALKVVYDTESYMATVEAMQLAAERTGLGDEVVKALTAASSASSELAKR